jgi:hypothetical protein
MVGASVPQAAALEQLVRRHAREHLWRAPVGGPYRVAVPHAMFEELRSHLAYECFDVAHLPAVATVSGTAGGSGAARGAAFATPNATSRGRTRPAPPASIQLAAVAQLLGEIRVDERDNEWMYALNGAIGDATCAGPKLMRAHDVGQAARARAIFLNQTRGSADLAGSADASVSANDDSDATVAGESPRAFGGLSLAATNRAFMLVADILRAAARVAADAAGQGAALSGSQKPQQQQPSRNSTLAINNQAISGALGVQPTLSSSSVQFVPDAVLSELLAQFEHTLEGAAPTDGTVCALRQLVAAGTAPVAVAATGV